MKSLWPVALIVVCVGCNKSESPLRPNREANVNASLAEARKGHSTQLVFTRPGVGDPAPTPPKHLFQLVKYPSPVGKLAAYVSNPPAGGKKHPAIIWIFGGFGNDIGEPAWQPGPPSNDQSASAFRRAGIVMMYPSLRGAHDNPGQIEGFYGEVDDVIAARDYLAAQPFVDPNRIYLGGHSTGGTLALLVAESTNKFRAVFAFGPVHDVAGYGEESLPFAQTREELKLRAPVEWLDAITTPTYVFEGSDGNAGPLRLLKARSKNPQIHFYELPERDHFDILAPVTKVIAKKILQDTQGSVNIIFSLNELGR